MSGTDSKARIGASAKFLWSLLLRWSEPIFLRPAAEILLLRGAGSGLLIWLVLALTPRLALAALAGSLMGEIVRRMLAVDDTGGFDGCLKVNALLAAVMVAAITAPAQLDFLTQAVLIAGAAALAAWLGGAIRQGLPPSVNISPLAAIRQRAMVTRRRPQL